MDQASSQPFELPTVLVGDQGSARGRLALPDGTLPQLGNYRLLHLIAEGGFAEVYLGKHIHLINNYAAIKVMHTRLEQSDLARFRDEASIVARLRHPHIISVREFDFKDGMPFLVMDYAPNGTLRQRHPRYSRLAPGTILFYLMQIAEGLQFAHDQRFVHRDIKPENMLIDERNNILLSDFGIAVVFSTQMHSNREIVGTVSYMAPEQLQGQPLMASDQYALGVVLYEWLCGECPFKGSLAEIAAQHFNRPPPSLVERVPEIPPALESVVMRALAKRPDERFSSVMELAYAFGSSFRSQPLRLSPGDGNQALEPLETPVPYAPTVMARSGALQTQALAEKGRLTLSRRALLAMGIAGAAGMVGIGAASGFVTWLMLNKRRVQAPLASSGTPAVSKTSTSSPASTPVPPGTLFHTYRGHRDVVLGVASSGDGAYVASASKDTTVQVWDTATGGNHAAAYTGHTAAVMSVSWSPDQAHIVSGGADNTARVWLTSNASMVFAYTSHGAAVNAVGWSPDGTRIASGSSDKTVQVWNAADGSNPYVYSGHTDAVYALAWSPDGSHIASGGADTTVQVWNSTDGGQLFAFTRHSAPVFAIAWSPDGSMIASGGADKTVRVWRATDGTPIYIYGGHSNTVSGLAWSPDGQYIASASQDGTVQVWRALDGSNAFTYMGHSAAVNAVSWPSHPGTLLISGSSDTTVQIWQA
jgi:serine/threonine protein kinase